MARRSSGGRSAPPAPAPAPKPPQRAPPQAESRLGGSVLSKIGSKIGPGFFFGAGSELGKRTVDAVMGPRTCQPEEEGKRTVDAVMCPCTCQPEEPTPVAPVPKNNTNSNTN